MYEEAKESCDLISFQNEVRASRDVAGVSDETTRTKILLAIPNDESQGVKSLRKLHLKDSLAYPSTISGKDRSVIVEEILKNSSLLILRVSIVVPSVLITRQCTYVSRSIMYLKHPFDWGRYAARSLGLVAQRYLSYRDDKLLSTLYLR